MRFIWKFFRALNSAQTPWQITWALALGMVLGLTPVSGLQTVFIMLLAFVLNIHLGLFFIASAFFAGVGYLFDPWFEALGFALLSNEALQGFWTALYNTTLGRLSFFNNTIVLGSLIVALIAAVPLVWILNRLIRSYRTQLEGLLQRHPLFGKFGLLSVADKPMAMFRWWGLAVFILLTALVAVVIVLVADPLLKRTVESTLSGVLQRPVSVASASVGFSDFNVEVKRLEVASEQDGVNALSIDTVRIDPDLSALIFQSVHVQEVLLEGIGFETDSQNPMPAAKGVTPEPKPAGGKSVSLPSLSLPSPESILADADLASVKLFESSQKEIAALEQKWQKVADEEFSDEALKELQAELNTLKTLAQSKDPQKLLMLKEKVADFTANVKERKRRIAALQKEFDADKQRVNALIADVKAAPQKDFERLKEAYGLSSSGTMNIVGMLFGEQVKAYLARAKQLYATLSPYLKGSQEETPPPPERGDGRWFAFAAEMPRFWIEKVKMNGELNAQQFDGTITHISENQSLLQKPTILQLVSDGPNVEGLKVSAELNRLEDVARDTVTVAAKRYALDEMGVGIVNVSQSDLAFDGKMSIQNASALEGSLLLAFNNASLATESLEGALANNVQKALKSVNNFNVKTQFSGTLSQPELTVTSDLDRQLSSAVQNVMKQEISAYEQSLKEGINAKTEGQLAALTDQRAGIVDIPTLAGDQNSVLDGLSKEASGMLSGSGAEGLKGVLPF